MILHEAGLVYEILSVQVNYDVPYSYKQRSSSPRISTVLLFCYLPPSTSATRLILQIVANIIKFSLYGHRNLVLYSRWCVPRSLIFKDGAESGIWNCRCMVCCMCMFYFLCHIIILFMLVILGGFTGSSLYTQMGIGILILIMNLLQPSHDTSWNRKLLWLHQLGVALCRCCTIVAVEDWFIFFKMKALWMIPLLLAIKIAFLEAEGKWITINYVHTYQ